jgi:hypothetical protein
VVGDPVHERVGERSATARVARRRPSPSRASRPSCGPRTRSAVPWRPCGARGSRPRRARGGHPGSPRTPRAGPRSRWPCRGPRGSRARGTPSAWPRARGRSRGRRTTRC